MKIVGINHSHDTSVAVVVDGQVQSVFEEERSRREKYWTPGDNENHEDMRMLCIEHYGVNIDADMVAFASFDRRDKKLVLGDKVFEDRLLQKNLIEAIAEKQLTETRFKELQEKFGPNIVKEFFEVNTSADHDFNQAFAHQFDKDHVQFEWKLEHHMFHAICGSHFSPYDESIVITMDGGGVRSYFEEYPGYQEIECIWHHKGDSVTPLWKKLSNHRQVSDIQAEFFENWGENCCHCKTDHEQTIDGVDVVFTSMPSNGMNFSNMSYALGCDDSGRAAGKVMGMASYGDLLPNVYTKHAVAQMLELDSFRATCGTIQKAIDYLPDVKNIVLSGGYALNCTNNAKYLREFPDHQFFVDPIPHDGGTAVGAALHEWRLDNEDN